MLILFVLSCANLVFLVPLSPAVVLIELVVCVGVLYLLQYTVFWGDVNVQDSPDKILWTYASFK